MERQPDTVDAVMQGVKRTLQVLTTGNRGRECLDSLRSLYQAVALRNANEITLGMFARRAWLLVVPGMIMLCFMCMCGADCCLQFKPQCKKLLLLSLFICCMSYVHVHTTLVNSLRRTHVYHTTPTNPLSHYTDAPQPPNTQYKPVYTPYAYYRHTYICTFIRTSSHSHRLR